MLWVPMVIMLVVTLVALTLTIVSKTQLRIYKNVRARKELTKDILSSIFDNIIMYLSSIVDKKQQLMSIINDNRRGIYES